MTPLVQQFTQNLKPCTGCGKTDLSDTVYDQFWSQQEKPNAIRSHETDSSGSEDTGGSGSEIQ